MAETKVTGRELADDYSTNEVNTGRKWIDGKDIYQKTVNFGALPNTSTKNVAHGITGLSYIIDISGVAFNGTTNAYVPLPFASGGGGPTTMQLAIVGANIEIITGTDRSAFTVAYVTLEYTKT